MTIKLSQHVLKQITYATGLAAGVIMIMAGHNANSIAEAKRLIDLGQDLGSGLVDQIRREAEMYKDRK
jgi:hypothetical protein